jgi:hypothetical protein
MPFLFRFSFLKFSLCILCSNIHGYCGNAVNAVHWLNMRNHGGNKIQESLMEDLFMSTPVFHKTWRGDFFTFCFH